MRINKIANLIKNNSKVIDVGSDHAKLAILLLKNKKASFVYNIEIAKNPLQNTINNLKKENLLDRTQNILNDGLKDLQIKGKIDYCNISGMGGLTIIDILKNKANKLKIQNFIFLPNNNAYKLRKYLKQAKFKISYEEIIKEKNHYYELIMTSKKGQSIKSDADCYFGPYNLKHPSKEFKQYINFKTNKIKVNKLQTKNIKIKKEYELLKKVCA